MFSPRRAMGCRVKVGPPPLCHSLPARKAVLLTSVSNVRWHSHMRGCRGETDWVWIPSSTTPQPLWPSRALWSRLPSWSSASNTSVWGSQHLSIKGVKTEWDKLLLFCKCGKWDQEMLLLVQSHRWDGLQPTLSPSISLKCFLLYTLKSFQALV